jgi:hypothetical protein
MLAVEVHRLEENIWRWPVSSIFTRIKPIQVTSNEALAELKAKT